ncbi:MAG TPA: PEP-CTERM sorting domain-containing protein [Candidatus Bathyarchaeia archaeon]|nr:PEP-CTERM sorting domain-containing protein [Candidatus Bathyarchaeia archaeon]
MKKILCLMIVCLICSVAKAHAGYVIDGSILDWGVDLSLSGSDLKGFLDTNLPGKSSVDVVTEDNTDKNGVGYVFVGPGYSTKNTYDAEAMYFDNDDTYAYLAIVSGLERSEGTYPAGDIFIATTADPFSTNKYEYAINVFTGDVYLVGTTAAAVQNVSYTQHSEANPWRLSRTNTGAVSSANTWVGKLDSDEFVYGSLYKTHTVIEARIPLAWINADNDVWAHWTMKCGNDYLNLHGTVTTTPEPATVMLLGSGLLGLAGLRRRKSKV